MNQVALTRRALYVSAFLPDEYAPHAGGQAAYQNRRDLEHAGYEVTSLVCTTKGYEALTNDQKTTVFRQTRFTALTSYLCNILVDRTAGLLAWPVLDTRANFAFERRLRQELKHGDYEIVFADFTQVMLPILRALKGLREKPRSRCCVHDLHIQRMLRSTSAFAYILTGPVVRTERSILREFDEVVTLSDKDRALAAHLYDLSHVSVRPWTPPRWTQKVIRTPERVNPAEMLFFANFARPENAEAATWLLEQAWPTIRRAVPVATLVLGGAGSDQVRLPSGTENVRQIGFLENPGKLFECCELVVAPLAQGAGVKFKVLEALACGVTVVGTAVALEGIDRGPLIIEADRDHFTAKLIELLNPRLACSEPTKLAFDARHNT